MSFEIKALLVMPLPEQVKIEEESLTPLHVALCVEHLQFFCFKCTLLHCSTRFLKEIEGPIKEIKTGLRKLKQELDRLLADGDDADKRKKKLEEIERVLSPRLIKLDGLAKGPDERKRSEHK